MKKVSQSRAYRAWVLGFGLFWAISSLPHAHASSFEMSYDVRILGIRIGRAHIAGGINGANYHMSGNGKISGLANMVVSGHGEASSSGTYGPNGPTASQYHIFNTAGDKTNDITIAFSGKNVTSMSVQPPSGEHPDRVPITAVHKTGVIDPLSGFLIPRTTKGAVTPAECNQTLQIFDGRQRYDISLEPKGVRKLQGTVGGFSGEVLVCRAEYEPLAGHRPSKKVTRYLTSNPENEIWLVPTADGKTLVPLRIQLRTIIGNLVIEANSYKSQ